VTVVVTSPEACALLGALALALLAGLTALAVVLTTPRGSDQSLMYDVGHQGDWIIHNANMASNGTLTLMRMSKGRFALYCSGMRTDVVRAHSVEYAIEAVKRREQQAA